MTHKELFYYDLNTHLNSAREYVGALAETNQTYGHDYKKLDRKMAEEQKVVKILTDPPKLDTMDMIDRWEYHLRNGLSEKELELLLQRFKPKEDDDVSKS